jgi:hypothetical protein
LSRAAGRGGAARAAGLAALLLGAALAPPAAAEVRRFEVVGAVALDPAKPPPAPRHAALRAALQEAVARAAAELVREATGKEPAGEPAPPPGEPTEYAVSYRVLEDRGEQPALLAGGAAGGREYVVVAEVQIDLDRVRLALKGAGRLGSDAPAAAPAVFRLELLDVPSPAAWSALRAALARAGAEVEVPLELEPGRAMLEVRAAGGAERTVERLLHAALPEGLGLERLPSEPGAPRLRVRQGVPAPPPPEAAGAAPGTPEAIDTESPNRY